MAKANLTKAANIQVTVREKDFVSQFAKNWEALQEIWGIMNPIKKEPGSKLVSYTASVTLANGAVGEGEEGTGRGRQGARRGGPFHRGRR